MRKGIYQWLSAICIASAMVLGLAVFSARPAWANTGTNCYWVDSKSNCNTQNVNCPTNTTCQFDSAASRQNGESTCTCQ
jgi:hypothetical protein